MAGMMDRLARLIRANVNDLIDQAEDPEKMIDQILREMQDSIRTAKAQVAAMIAQEKELEADLLGMVGCGRGGMCARNLGVAPRTCSITATAPC